MKKVFKKSFAVFLSAVLLLSVLPFTVSAAEIVNSGTTGDCTWTLDSEGTLTISGNGAMGNYSYSSSAPWKNSGLSQVVIEEGVTSIGDYAFNYCRDLTTVNIPASVTSIGDYAFFHCYRMTTVTIPDSVTRIGTCALSFCDHLLTITVDENNNAYCSIDGNLYDKNGTTLIQYAAGKPEESFTVSDSVTSIGDYAFYWCDNLTTVTIPDSVTSIGDNAFSDCNILTIFCVKDSYAEAYAKSHFISFVAVEKSTHFSYQVFADGTAKITGYNGNGGNVVIPSVIDGHTVTSFGDEAFADCSSLTTVTIPNSVTSIGSDAFRNCDNLTIHCIKDSCAETYAKNHHIPFVATEDPAHFTYQINQWLGNGTVEITGYTGNGGDVVIPSVINGHTVTRIGDWAFDGCYNLTAVIIPDSITGIGNYAFEGCSDLTSVTILDSVTDIGNEAFGLCTSLTAVTIPDSVTSIGSDIWAPNAFVDCWKLTHITVDPNNPTYDSRNNCNAIINTESNQLITGCKTTVIPDTVTSIGDEAFSGDFSFLYGEMITIEIPGSVVSIGKSAFAYCDALEAVHLSEGLTSIGERAFSGCFSLTRIALPESATSIGSYAFGNCYGLTSVFIPDSVTAIGEDAFWHCNNLTIYGIAGSYAEIYANENNIPFVAVTDFGTTGDCIWWLDSTGTLTISGNGAMANYNQDAPWKELNFTEAIIENGVTNIGDNAFYDCTKLTGITIADSVTGIGGDAFYACDALEEIIIPDSVTSIDHGAFSYCVSLKSVTLSNQLENIAMSAFYSCDSLTDIIIPDSVTNIDAWAFFGCDSLTSVTISDSVTSIGECAFFDCEKLKAVSIPNSVISIGYWAFQDCYELAEVHISESVTSIGDGDGYNNAFIGCRKLARITVDPNNPVFDSRNNCNAIINTESNQLITGCRTTVIPDSVTSIGNYAFDDSCFGMTSIFIPESITAIGKDAFYQCNNLTIYGIAGSYAETYANQNNIPFVAVTDFGTTGDCIWWLDSAGTLNVSGDGKMANYPNSLNLPWGTDRVNTAVFEDGVTNIGKCAFKNNTGLQSVTIPDSVTAINSFAFYGCTALQTITIPSSVTSIGTSVFDNCNNLTIYGVKGSYAERYAHQNNIPFTAVCPSCGSTELEVVPAVAATTTQAGATEGLRCKQCGKWMIKPKTTAKLEEEIVDSGTTGDCTWKLDSAGTLTVSGTGKMGNYANSLNLPWGNNRVKAVILEDGVTSIGKCAFKNNKRLQSIIIPDSVTAIYSFAFYGCSSLQTVTIPASVTSIAVSSSSYCDALTILGEKGSYAEGYATQNNIPFVPVCPVCGGSEFEAVPGSPSDMRCTHCSDGVVIPSAAPMGAVPFTVGDISGNNDVGIEDATLLQQYLAEMIELDLEDEITFLQADVNGDGYVNVKDVTAVQRQVAELI